MKFLTDNNLKKLNVHYV